MNNSDKWNFNKYLPELDKLSKKKEWHGANPKPAFDYTYLNSTFKYSNWNDAVMKPVHVMADKFLYSKHDLTVLAKGSPDSDIDIIKVELEFGEDKYYYLLYTIERRNGIKTLYTVTFYGNRGSIENFEKAILNYDGYEILKTKSPVTLYDYIELIVVLKQTGYWSGDYEG